jgi:hypothetical protein
MSGEDRLKQSRREFYYAIDEYLDILECNRVARDRKRKRAASCACCGLLLVGVFVLWILLTH